MQQLAFFGVADEDVEHGLPLVHPMLVQQPVFQPRELVAIRFVKQFAVQGRQCSDRHQTAIAALMGA